MAELRSLVQRQKIGDYGTINVTLKEVLASRGITRNKLSKLTDVKYDIVNRYYQNEDISLVDLDIFSKFCFALDCTVEDLLKYLPPEQTDPKK